MPEGDSLVQLAHRLRPVMEGQVLTASDFRVPQYATLDLAGWTVDSIRPRGKYLSMHVTAHREAETATGQLVILSHLGMDGSWKVDARPTQQTRCVLGLAQHTVVGFSLAVLDVVTPQLAQEQLAFLGPDLLGPGWEDPSSAEQLRDEVLANFRAAPDQPVGTALLDQRLVAGIGNIYRCELLLLAGLRPHQLVSELSDRQVIDLVSLSQAIMAMNVPPRSPLGAPRSTVDVRPDPQAPFGVRAATAAEQARALADRRRHRGRTPRFWVYGRQREGCLRCGGPIRVEALGAGPAPERTVYWCPHCQAA